MLKMKQPGEGLISKSPVAFPTNLMWRMLKASFHECSERMSGKTCWTEYFYLTKSSMSSNVLTRHSHAHSVLSFSPVIASMKDMVPRTAMTIALASSSTATKNGELNT